MDWEIIPEFPDYSVSAFGKVRNEITGRVLAMTQNQHGILHVGLMRDGRQHKRAVALLVARMFLPAPEPDTFDTPINLDGDRGHCVVDNLMWRPRWFAVRYHKQFFSNQRGFVKPIVEIHTGERFKTSWDAATKYGLLDREIMTATINRTYVWPTYQQFRLIEE